MRTAVSVTVLALSLVTGACVGGTAGPDFTKVDSDAIRQANQEHVAAFNERSIDRVLATFAENSVFMPPNAPLLRGKDPLRAFYTSLFERGGQLAMEIDEVNGHGPLAYESGTYSIQYTDASPSRDRGKYLRVLRNQNGWRTEKMIWSSDLPRPAGS